MPDQEQDRNDGKQWSAADLEDLAQQASAAGSKTSVVVRPALADALATAWSLSPRIVVAGSIFLLGDVLREIETA